MTEVVKALDEYLNTKLHEKDKKLPIITQSILIILIFILSIIAIPALIYLGILLLTGFILFIIIAFPIYLIESKRKK